MKGATRGQGHIIGAGWELMGDEQRKRKERKVLYNNNSQMEPSKEQLCPVHIVYIYVSRDVQLHHLFSLRRENERERCCAPRCG